MTVIYFLALHKTNNSNGSYQRDSSVHRKDASRSNQLDRNKSGVTKSKPITPNMNRNIPQILDKDPLAGLLDDNAPPKIDKPIIPTRNVIPEIRDPKEKVILIIAESFIIFIF